MLKFKAFMETPSTKRGHKVGEMEQIVTQAVRTCTNVKNRQTRAEEAGINLVTSKIEEENMLDHKVLLFLLEPGMVDKNIAGLIANKIMSKYQRPCCMLTKTEDGYAGSARGCDKVGITEFKDICAGTGVTEFVAGHQGAFGLGLRKENIDKFISETDETLKDMPDEAIYRVDYIWRANDADPQAIIDIGEMDEYWGKDVDEALVAITGIQVTKDNITMMKSNTVKITLPNNISIIKFRMSDEEFNTLYSENGYVEIDIVGKCNVNEWAGNRYPQIFLEDYNIIQKCAYVF
jgi:single-stranded-DNA-specific exonuclease